MEKNWNKSQAAYIFVVASGLSLFVVSALKYRDFGFFLPLFVTRILVCLIGFLLATLLYFDKIKTDRVDTGYFLQVV